MNEQEIVERLKKNEKPFGLLLDDEQNYLNKVLKKYIRGYYGDDWNIPLSIVKHITYQLVPDYQPEPLKTEDDDVEIIITNGVERLGIMLDGEWFPLWEIPAMPKFEEFRFQDETGTQHVCVDICLVAKHMNDKPFARFRK